MKESSVGKRSNDPCRFGPREVPTFNTLLASRWEEAEGYTRLGLAVVPLPRGEKRPAIKWKAYQTVAPTSDEVNGWWHDRPDDGMAVVLGPVSGVLAVDVDGPEAHAELMRRLGAEPVAPKVLTGSGKPCRYQLLFRHPTDVATRAKSTPWHPQLEFRGQGGLSVLPPSVHPSGRPYRWAAGRSLEDMRLPELPPLVLDALRASAEARDVRTEVDREAVTVGPDGLSQVQTRALALLRRCVAATQGVGGDKATYTAACYLVKDFALTVEQALPVLSAWNRTHCRPKWSESDLLHKLRKADESPGQRGRLLDAAATQTSIDKPDVPKVNAVFQATVPDWVECSWEIVRPSPVGVRKGRPRITVQSIINLLLANVVLQKNTILDLPDMPLAQLLWGGDGAKWPKRWQAKLTKQLKRLMKANRFHTETINRGCSPHCHLAGTRHRHLRFRLVHESTLNIYNLFATGGTEEAGFTYDFAGRRSHHDDPKVAKVRTKMIRQLVKDGKWCAIYLPAWVFGMRTLPPGPCRILQSMTRELTRERGRKPQRADHAELLRHTDTPILNGDTLFVGFNGNGRGKRAKYHGVGYSLGTRMKRAAYPHEVDGSTFRASAKKFFRDLSYLEPSLGIMATIRMPGRDGLLTADQAIDEVDVVNPARLARRCLIKLYAPADYADLWRAYFASKLELSLIPKGAPGEFLPSSSPESMATSEQLARWMKQADMRDAELAEELGVCRTLVNKFRKGSRIPSAKFLKKWNRYMAKKLPGIEPNVTESGPKRGRL